MSIILENEQLRLVIGEDALPVSLLCKESGEECLEAGHRIPLFSVTQDRPFNNEIKLSYPNKRTTYPANRIRREGDKLIVGFALAPYEAVVEVTEKPRYIAFRLVEFLTHQDSYPGLVMETPPVREFRVLQLPVKDRKYFGEWLNVSWDERAAVNVLATSPFTHIDSEHRDDFRVLYADLMRDDKLKGIGAALITAPGDKLLDCIADVEEDFDLPRGVASRRNPEINRSTYWTHEIDPTNVDEHIKYAKMGGFTKMLIYYSSIFKQYEYGYDACGEYEYKPEFPEGAESLRKMLAKIQAAGIDPGLHVLQTFIGIRTHYVTPVADHRLNLLRHFTLSRPYTGGDELYVEQNPEGTVLHEHIRMPEYDAKVLQFGGELFHYTGYTTEYPYHFTGVTRGHFDTLPQEHPLGQIGGLLDVTEFSASAIYMDQKTSLQDEVAAKIGEAYRQGFKFMYYDGSEGANAPHEIYVPYAQYRVYRQLQPAPLYTEGAAKAHFSWHFLSGGNAFDVFQPCIFKKMINRHPAEEAPRMRQDFTRLNFGWWGFWEPKANVFDPDFASSEHLPTENLGGSQADMMEYGTSRAAAWDCPATIQCHIKSFKAHPRFADCFEVMRRWEDVRQKNWLTDAQKLELRNLEQEHTLLINEDGAYELVPYDAIETEFPLSAFVFERKGARYVVYWHQCAAGKLKLPVSADKIEVVDALGGKPVAVEAAKDGAVVPAENKRYLKTSLSREEIVRAFENAKMQ